MTGHGRNLILNLFIGGFTLTWNDLLPVNGCVLLRRSNCCAVPCAGGGGRAAASACLHRGRSTTRRCDPRWSALRWTGRPRCSWARAEPGEPWWFLWPALQKRPRCQSGCFCKPPCGYDCITHMFFLNTTHSNTMPPKNSLLSAQRDSSPKIPPNCNSCLHSQRFPYSRGEILVLSELPL